MSAATDHRQRRRLARGVLIGLLLLGACSGDGDGDDASDRDAEPTTTTDAGDVMTERQVVGEAHVEAGERSWDLELTSCGVAAGRFTAQGDDQDGVTVVATFLIETGAGSVIVTDGDESWAVGAAGGTEVADIEVTEASATGEGPFTPRSLAADDSDPGQAEPPAAAGPAEAGTFDVRCER